MEVLNEESSETNSEGDGPKKEIDEMLKVANVISMADIQDLFKETIARFMENGLQNELNDELGYDCYD